MSEEVKKDIDKNEVQERLLDCIEEYLEEGENCSDTDLKYISKAKAPFAFFLEGVPHIAVPQNEDNKWDVIAQENLLEKPARLKGDITFIDADSFCQFVRDYKNEFTNLYLKSDLSDLLFRALAVFNDNKPDSPNWRDHLARFEPVLSPEWTRWTGSNGATMSQTSFAVFIEDNIADIYCDEKLGTPTAAEVYEAVTNLFDCRNVTFSSRVNVSNGMASFAYTEKDGGEKKVAVPTEFLIAIPVFEYGPKYTIRVKLRYRVNRNSGELALWYELQQLNRVFEVAANGLSERIKKNLEGTEIPIYLGALPAL